MFLAVSYLITVAEVNVYNYDYLRHKRFAYDDSE